MGNRRDEEPELNPSKRNFVQGSAALVGATTLATVGLGAVSCTKTRPAAQLSSPQAADAQRTVVADKLDDRKLREALVGGKIYGFTSHSRLPYTLELRQDGSAELVIDGNAHPGTYIIENSQVFTRWAAPQYESSHPASNYHPLNPRRKDLLAGRIGVEFWELPGVSGTKRVFIKRHDNHEHEWGSPCFVYNRA